MAAFTFCAQPPLVMAIFMAIAADLRRFGELLRDVAAFARHRGVQPDEGKFGQIVIEDDRFAPAVVVVTALARGP